MTDTTQGASTKPPKTPVADRQWVDASNTQVDDPALATGCRYIDLDMQVQKLPCAFVYQTGLPAGNHATMLAIFGALTKAGNIRNTLVNSKGGDGTNVMQGIEDWFDELITNSNWAADRVGGGIRVNPEALAKAIAVVKGEHHEGAHTKYLDRIINKDKVLDPGDKAGKKEILYSTFALRNKQVEAEYNRQLPQHAAAPDLGQL